MGRGRGGTGERGIDEMERENIHTYTERQREAETVIVRETRKSDIEIITSWLQPHYFITITYFRTHSPFIFTYTLVLFINYYHAHCFVALEHITCFIPCPLHILWGRFVVRSAIARLYVQFLSFSGQEQAPL